MAHKKTAQTRQGGGCKSCVFQNVLAGWS
jgi:hypothetical protein